VRLRIVAIGRLKEDYLRAAIADYTNRIKPYARIELEEVPGLPDPLRGSRASVARIQDGEAVLLLHRLQPGEQLVALDSRGLAMTSEDFAEFLRPQAAAGASATFVIGGSWGLGRAVLDRAVIAISLSPMTFPHAIARLILLEQVYRAFKILRGEAYHK